MKVLIVNSLDKRYGSTYRCRKFAEILRQGGFEVTYIESNLDAVDSHNISIRQSDEILGYLLGNIKRFFFCLKLEYDLAIVQKFIPLTAPCMLAAKLKGKTLIVDWDDIDRDLQTSFFRRCLVAFTEWLWPKFADAITTHSGVIEKLASARTNASVYLVSQPLDFDLFDPVKASKDRVSSKLGLQDKFVVGYLCTLTQGGSADLDIVLKALAPVLKRHSNMVFLVIGGGPREKEVRLMLNGLNLESSVVITGLVDQNEVPDYLAVCSVSVVFMRDTEGNRARVSFKVLESLAMNVNVIGHIVGETAGRFGKYMTETGEDRGRLALILEDAYNGKLPVVGAREDLRRDYSLEKVSEQLISAIKHVEENHG